MVRYDLRVIIINDGKADMIESLTKDAKAWHVIVDGNVRSETQC